MTSLSVSHFEPCKIASEIGGRRRIQSIRDFGETHGVGEASAQELARHLILHPKPRQRSLDELDLGVVMVKSPLSWRTKTNRERGTFN